MEAALGIFSFISVVVLWIYVSNLIENKSNEKAEAIYFKKKDELLKEISTEKKRIENELQKRISDLKLSERGLELKIEIQDKLFEEKTIGFPWVAHQYALIKTTILEEDEKYFRTKNRPAPKTADAIRAAKLQVRESEKKYFMAQGMLNYYESLIPNITDLIDAPDEIIEAKKPIKDDTEYDQAKSYLRESEWQNLATHEKYQRALERYWKKDKSRSEIGRLYERYIGSEYENDGWDVTFFGAIKGLEDLGRDLIVRKQKKVCIIQCKNWASDKTIHEKHIIQLHGTCVLYEIETHKKPKGIFVTSCTLSDTAKKCATLLGIDVIENKKLINFPCIKCNISKNGEKIYHLPFDQQYDRIKISKKDGEFYCSTVLEAENAGFRRALRWKGNA